jgi:hypothetical protein
VIEIRLQIFTTYRLDVSFCYSLLSSYKRNESTVLVRKPETKRPVGRPNRRGNNIKMEFEKYLGECGLHS